MIPLVKIEISDKLYKTFLKKAKESGFKTAEEYLEFILKELLVDEENISSEDEAQVKERLKDLGYL